MWSSNISNKVISSVEGYVVIHNLNYSASSQKISNSFFWILILDIHFIVILTS